MNSFDKKLIIFDPVCGISIGHNLPTINKYARWAANEFGFKSEAWVATKKNEPTEYLSFRKLSWVYGYWLHSNLKEEIKSKKKILRNESILDIARNSTHHILAHRSIKNCLEAAVNQKPEYVFFPGADFYSLLSILSIAKAVKNNSKTVFIIRLMGVMEWATKLPRARDIVSQVIFDIKNILGERARFTAETEKYAYELGAILNTAIKVTSIPSDFSNANTVTNKDSLRINIGCVGGARADKGYFDILELSRRASNAFESSPEKNICFTLQSMSPRNLDFNWQYQSDLAKAKNIKLVNSRLSDAELNAQIAQSDIMLLPYSQGTYAARGSAILFDTLPYGIPLLGVEGTGFGDSIRHAGIGLTYNGIDDYVNRLSELVNLSSSNRDHIKSNQANYSKLLLSNLKECFND